jgi:serine/alanine adding enzyme
MYVVNHLDEITWRSFLDEHPHANVFHTPEMFEVYSRTKGFHPELWAVIGENQQPQVIFVPIRITLHNGLFYPWTTRSVAYGGLLSAPSSSALAGLHTLLNTYTQSTNGHFLFTELRNMSDVSWYQPVLQKNNYIFEAHLNYLVDLDQSKDKLWQNLSKSCRQRIRISFRKGTVIEEVSSPDQLIAAYQLLHNLYSRIQVPLAPYNLFKAAYDVCSSVGMFKVFLARIGDQFIGSSFNLMYKDKILAWYSASDRDFSSYNPGELLKWHVFQWGKEHGYHQFDFGGAGKPNEPYGPREFKAKFGGELVNFGRNVCVHSPVRLKLSKTAYSFARKFSVISN